MKNTSRKLSENTPENLPDTTVTSKDKAMGSEPVGRLLIRMAIPATFGMAANGIYNVVDTIFIGRGVGPNAIGGLSVVFPIQMILLAFGIAIGQGASSVTSRSLGGNEPETARKAVGHAFFLSLLTGTVILLSGKIFIEPLLTVLGTVEPLRDHARDYLGIILYGAPFFCTSVTANNLARAEGRPGRSMTIMLIGSITNIVLDPIFIFVLNMGVAGAAWATVIAQILSFSYIMIYYVSGRMTVSPGLHHMKPELTMLRQIGFLGLPALVRQGGLSIFFLLINQMLGRYGGPIYISAHGIAHKIIIFQFMPALGILQGFLPIAGYNYGARQYKRVIQVLKLACFYIAVYGIITSLCVIVFSKPLVRVFTTDISLIATGRTVIYYLQPFFAAIGIQLIGSTYFIVVGKAVPSLILNLLRQFILLIPLILILPPLLGVRGVLLSLPISDFLSVVITLFFLGREVRHIRNL